MNKSYIIFSFLIFQISLAAGQIDAVSDTIKPQLIAGDTTIEKYVAANTHYPEIAKSNCWRGKVIIGFKVLSSGNLEDITIIKNSVRPFDAEALRVVLSSKGKWKPATLKDTPIDFYMTLTVSFWYDDFHCSEVLKNGDSMFKLAEWMEKSRLLYESGVQKLTNKQYEDALKDFNESLRINSTDKDALYNRGVCKQNLGDQSGACEDWKKSKKLSDQKEKEEINLLLDKYCK